MRLAAATAEAIWEWLRRTQHVGLLVIFSPPRSNDIFHASSERLWTKGKWSTFIPKLFRKSSRAEKANQIDKRPSYRIVNLDLCIEAGVSRGGICIFPINENLLSTTTAVASQTCNCTFPRSTKRFQISTFALKKCPEMRFSAVSPQR